MTQEEIIEMVMQIGGCDRPEEDSPALKMFVTFAKLVAEKAIKEALAQPEPVAKKKHEPKIDLGKYAGTYGGYTTPPAQRTWVGLTAKEKHEFRYSHMTTADFIEDIEAKLKEKNT